MKTVAAAIKEDLARVKDVLDIFVRTGMNKSSELVPQLELLKKISDTLGVLGLGELRSDIDGEIDRLKSVVERGGGTSRSNHSRHCVHVVTRRGPARPATHTTHRAAQKRVVTRSRI